MKSVDSQGRALGGASKIVNENDGANGLEPVKLVTIDESVGENSNIVIIQLDVEGHEKEALTGSLRTLKRCAPILILEDLSSGDLFSSSPENS